MPNRSKTPAKAGGAAARMSRKEPLTQEQVQLLDAWWRASN